MDNQDLKQYLNKPDKNSILFIYDFSSGESLKFAEKNPKYIDKYTKKIAKIINQYEYNSIMEAGVGEGIMLKGVMEKTKPVDIYGFDISWSRVKYARKHLGEKPFLFVADLFNIPLADNSIDIVYTSHAIESNQGREAEALKELYRVTAKYLILLEPAYDFADRNGQRRIYEHRYIQNLHHEIGKYNVLIHEPFGLHSNPLNPTGLTVIKKESSGQPLLVCPNTHAPLEKINDSYYTREGKLVYPIIGGIPCFLSDKAILAAHYLD